MRVVDVKNTAMQPRFFYKRYSDKKKRETKEKNAMKTEQ
jgi:hypothetical protein